MGTRRPPWPPKIRGESVLLPLGRVGEGFIANELTTPRDVRPCLKNGKWCSEREFLSTCTSCWLACSVKRKQAYGES